MIKKTLKTILLLISSVIITYVGVYFIINAQAKTRHQNINDKYVRLSGQEIVVTDQLGIVSAIDVSRTCIPAQTEWSVRYHDWNQVLSFNSEYVNALTKKFNQNYHITDNSLYYGTRFATWFIANIVKDDFIAGRLKSPDDYAKAANLTPVLKTAKIIIANQFCDLTNSRNVFVVKYLCADENVITHEYAVKD